MAGSFGGRVAHCNSVGAVANGGDFTRVEVDVVFRGRVPAEVTGHVSEGGVGHFEGVVLYGGATYH